MILLYPQSPPHISLQIITGLYINVNHYVGVGPLPPLTTQSPWSSIVPEVAQVWEARQPMQYHMPLDIIHKGLLSCHPSNCRLSTLCSSRLLILFPLYLL